MFDHKDVEKILEISKIGMWRVEFEEEKAPRFYSDSVLNELLGIEDSLTPEEKFEFHHKRIHRSDLKLFEEYSDKLATTRAEISYRYNHPTKGEMYVRCSGMRDMNNTDFCSYVGTYQDISDTVRLEKTKLAEKRLAEAVAQKEEALMKAKKASAAKSDFLSKMSHDIRTPLNGIIGIMDINEKHSDDFELVKANRAKARVAADHLLTLINDILDMSKLEDENTELEQEPLNLIRLCNEAAIISDIKAKENGITLSTDGGADLKYPDVFGSKLHLKRVFLNLINNSIKYNKPGGEIFCKAYLMFYDEKHVVYKFEISDTGIGMSEEYLNHIYEPFTQEKKDARSHYQGSGMGMAIVKKIVEKMNGTIEVTSKIGVGTKFEITIPFEINPNPQNEEIIEATSEETIEGMNIMLVEDNELNADIAKFVLEDFGASVTTCVNGKEAFDLYYDKPVGTFDAILMDVMMPVLDGYKATRMIRKSDKADSITIPIIAMTANAFAEDVKAAKEAGMNEHLAKPLSVTQLLKTLVYYKGL